MLVDTDAATNRLYHSGRFAGENAQMCTNEQMMAFPHKTRFTILSMFLPLNVAVAKRFDYGSFGPTKTAHSHAPNLHVSTRHAHSQHLSGSASINWLLGPRVARGADYELHPLLILKR